MMTLTSVEIVEYRAELAAIPDALRALDMIEDCEGDLEDAAIALALQSGQEPDTSEQWLAGLAKRWRVFLCRPDMQAKLQDNSIADAVRTLAAEPDFPSILAAPVVIHVRKMGVPEFCEPLEEKL
jgi:hypothetical protein